MVPSNVLRRDNSVSPRLEIIQNPRKRLDRLGTIAAGIVQQNDAAIAPLLFYALHNNVGTGSRPILRIDILEDGEIAQILRDLQRRQFAQLRRTGICRVRADGTAWSARR